MPGLLQNHIAVVTGGASGIGRAIALGYAREGAQVAVLDINSEGAAKTAADIRDADGKAHYFKLDVTDRMACRAIAAEGRRPCRPGLDPRQRCRHQSAQRVC